MAENRGKNCIDIVRPFISRLSEEGVTNLQVFGGIVSAALEHPDTEIIPDYRWVVAPENLRVDQFRANRTLRDFDALLLTSDQTEVDRVERAAKTIIGDELEVSLFGLRPVAQLEAQRRHPFRSLIDVVVGDRYTKMQDGQVAEAVKSLFPFAVPMDLESLETWRLFIGERDLSPMPIPHPGAAVLNHRTRGHMGLRPKDTEKIHRVEANIFAKVPDFRDWIIDGPGSTQLELAKILHSMGLFFTEPRYLILGDSLRLPLPKNGPADHSAFMLTEASSEMQKLVIGIARAKAIGEKAVSSIPGVTTFWQKHGEQRVENKIKNKTSSAGQLPG